MSNEPHGRILVMRHAQTVANLQACFLGQRNAPLTPAGEEQSRAGIEGLVAWKPDRIVTSPLDRCRLAIAEPAAQRLGVPCAVDQRLIELDFGPLEDRGYREVEELGMPLPWGPTANMWPPEEGGEPLAAYMARIKSACADLAALEGKTAVVCHGGVIRGMLSAWIDFGFGSFWKTVVGNVASFEFNACASHVELVRAGIDPDLLGRYA